MSKWHNWHTNIKIDNKIIILAYTALQIEIPFVKKLIMSYLLPNYRISLASNPFRLEVDRN